MATVGTVHAVKGVCDSDGCYRPNLYVPCQASIQDIVGRMIEYDIKCRHCM